MDNNICISSLETEVNICNKDILYRIFEKLVQRGGLHILLHNNSFEWTEIPAIAVILCHKLTSNVSYDELIKLYKELEDDWAIRECAENMLQQINYDMVVNDKEKQTYEKLYSKSTLGIPEKEKKIQDSSSEDLDCISSFLHLPEFDIRHQVAYLFSKFKTLKGKRKLIIYKDWEKKEYNPNTFLSEFWNTHKRGCDFLLVLFFGIIFPRRRRGAVPSDDIIIKNFLIMIENIIKEKKQLSKKDLIQSIQSEFVRAKETNFLKKNYLLNLWDVIVRPERDRDFQLLMFLFQKYENHIIDKLIKNEGINKNSKKLKNTFKKNL